MKDDISGEMTATIYASNRWQIMATLALSSAAMTNITYKPPAVYRHLGSGDLSTAGWGDWCKVA